MIYVLLFLTAYTVYEVVMWSKQKGKVDYRGLARNVMLVTVLVVVAVFSSNRYFDTYPSIIFLMWCALIIVWAVWLYVMSQRRLSARKKGGQQ
jgi:Ca2+/H+ antiporter